MCVERERKRERIEERVCVCERLTRREIKRKSEIKRRGRERLGKTESREKVDNGDNYHFQMISLRNFLVEKF